MNPLFFYNTLYNKLNTNTLPFWVLTPIRRIVRKIANLHLQRYLNGDRPDQKIEKGLIVSFTSFPARIGNVWQVVECMLRQSVGPEKIILWLSKEQFQDGEEVPEKLLLMQNERFKIRLVDGDVRSHKKYTYVCKEYPNNMIFLIDDDIYYAPDIIEKSIKLYRKNPNSVICNYGSKITFDAEGHHLSYAQWESIKDDDYIFFGSGGGTLFCPNNLYKDLTRIDLAMSLTPTADDIWLNAMARLVGTKILHSSNSTILPIINTNNFILSSINNGEMLNDRQIEAIENYYGRCFDRK